MNKRKEMDVVKLMMSQYQVEVLNDTMTQLLVEFRGPADSPYEGGTWKVRVELPDQYPYKSPSIGFTNKIFLAHQLTVAELSLLSQVKTLIYDEADFLFDNSDNSATVSQLQSMMPAAQQLLFSATYTDQVRSYISRAIGAFSEIRIEKEEDLNLSNIEQYVIRCEHEQKHETVADILKSVEMKCCLIFVNTKNYGTSLLEYLKKKGYTASIIGTGLVTDEVRDQIIEKMRRGEIKVLITSNVLSRGFDLRTVSLVVNLDIPMMMVRKGVFQPDPTTYLHRIGRTGRYGRKGVAVNVVADRESRDALLAIQRHFNSEINSVTIEGLAEAMVRVNVDYE